MSKRTNEKKSIKRILVSILVSILILILISGITMIVFLRKNDIHMVHGKVTTHFRDFEYNDGAFLIVTSSSLYTDTSLTLELAEAQFHTELQEGDEVYIFCKIYPEEIAPMFIKIYYLIRL